MIFIGCHFSVIWYCLQYRCVNCVYCYHVCCFCSFIQPFPLLIIHGYHKVRHRRLQLVNCSLIPVLSGLIFIVIVSYPLWVCDFVCACVHVQVWVCVIIISNHIHNICDCLSETHLVCTYSILRNTILKIQFTLPWYWIGLVH